MKKNSIFIALSIVILLLLLKEIIFNWIAPTRTPENIVRHTKSDYFNCNVAVQSSSDFIDRLQSRPLSSTIVHPIIKSLCPKVIAHYSQIPGYVNSIIAPLNYTVMGICLLGLINDAFSKAGVTWMVWAGSSLGQYLHGGPIPWDDDLDIIIDIAFNSSVCSIIHKYANSTGTLGCYTYSKGGKKLKKVTKIFFLFGDDINSTKVKEADNFKWPYIDSFYYIVDKQNNTFAEHLNRWTFPLEMILPPKILHFGGYDLPFPRRNDKSLFNIRNYDVNKCSIGEWDHRKELFRDVTQLDCCLLSDFFPFKKSICFDNGMKLDIISVKNRNLYWVLNDDLGPSKVSYSFNAIRKYLQSPSITKVSSC